jgi:predicted AlkP superfamily phosphohydrolase/phosphomutase
MPDGVAFPPELAPSSSVIRPMSTVRLASVFVALALGLTLAGACRLGHATGPRMIVLGFDGMDYRLTRELMDAGRMPNFSRLAAAGTFSSLGTTIPPQSPVAWSTFMTGLDADGHGIFDFVHRDPGTLEPYLSTARTEQAQRKVAIGSWQLPISGGQVKSLRQGQPFWELLEAHGIRTTIIRMPANYPPSGTASHELSGMGTPDLLGTYGTFSFFTSSPGPDSKRKLSGGRIQAVDVVDGVVRSELIGPDNPFRRPARHVTAPFTVSIDARSHVARITVGAEDRVLKVGEWSDWVPVDFALMPLQKLRGICRFYLKQVHPVFQLYASPINLDPVSPAMRISTPASYARELAEATGRYATQGMAEDTKALNERVFTRDEFLRQAALAGEEITRQYWTVLDNFTDGLLFYHFGNLDQVSHMLWRARDPGHPAYDPVADAPYATVIDDLYVAFDRIVGETIRRMGPETTLIVLSDHGFASWRRTFHLNTWLEEHGYLAVIDPAVEHDPGLFQNVDWSRTRAYGLGLNGLYINLRGRERRGIVDPHDRASLIQEIRQRLLETIDPATGRPVVTTVYGGRQVDAGGHHHHAGIAPDLIIGYAAGTRVSNESALGGLPPGTIVDNTQEWSGDHCMDPSAVPGILLTSRPLKRRVAWLHQVAAAILVEFRITGFPASR